MRGKIIRSICTYSQGRKLKSCSTLQQLSAGRLSALASSGYASLSVKNKRNSRCFSAPSGRRENRPPSSSVSSSSFFTIFFCLYCSNTVERIHESCAPCSSFHEHFGQSSLHQQSRFELHSYKCLLSINDQNSESFKARPL